MKRRLRLLIVTVLVVVPATAAVAKSFWIANADVTVVVNDDGSLQVTEWLTFDFSGDFSGAYRDIRLRPGEAITVVSVGDAGGTYQAGGCTELGCFSPAGTYGVEQHRDFVRVVWHHDSHNEKRTFKLVYQMVGLATVYDDVVDVNIRVWGDQWAVGLDRLAVGMEIPDGAQGGDVLVWGHPLGVNGSTALGDDGISPSLEASGIPSEQWVELRVVFPSTLLSSSGGATVIPGDGLQGILDEEARFAEDADAAAAAQTTGLIAGAVAAIVIVFGIGGLVFWYYGKEPRIDYDQEYEHEPPTDLTPAEVGALLSQGAVTEKEFTATLFDLIRLGAISASPSQVERVTWGGFKTETITDLVLDLTDKTTGFRNFEQSVLTVMRRVLELGPRPLHEFKEGIREDATSNAETYQTFRDRVLTAVNNGGLLNNRGQGVALLIGLGLIGLIVASFFLVPRALGNRAGGATIAVLVLVGMVVGSIVLFVFLAFRRVRTKRTPAGALEAARWVAFRRYLQDFSRLEEAPVISLDLWDRYLVYAITFGLAEEVLEHARLHAPPELESNSSLYWFGHYGYSGGHTENAFAGLQSALSGAFTPPSSGGGGGAW
ncbi:MAG: DUF2207 domain-containing protein [Acidimicrobiia bacterium]